MFSAALLLVALFSGVALAQETERQALTIQKEIALGAQLAADIRVSTTPVKNSSVQEYAERVGSRLSAHLRTPFTSTFEVVNVTAEQSPQEPLSLPGGHIFIPAAIILNAQNEDEFAGMLAHALAHAPARDTARAPSSFITGIPLVFIGGWDNGLPIPGAFLSAQRALEQAADSGAILLMRQAGYDPEALVRYIARNQPDNLGTHSALPERNARIAWLQEAIRKSPSDSLTAVQAQLRAELPTPRVRTPPSLLGR